MSKQKGLITNIDLSNNAKYLKMLTEDTKQEVKSVEVKYHDSIDGIGDYLKQTKEKIVKYYKDNPSMKNHRDRDKPWLR